VIIFFDLLLRVGDAFSALLACPCAEWNDRAFVFLDPASGFWFVASRLLIEHPSRRMPLF